MVCTRFDIVLGKSRDHFADTAALSLSGGDAKLMYPLACAMVRACALEGEYYVARDTSGLVGFCLWMPPGNEIFST
jgi:hypothetical protein